MLRQMGDVLPTTPLTRSAKRALPSLNEVSQSGLPDVIAASSSIDRFAFNERILEDDRVGFPWTIDDGLNYTGSRPARAAQFGDLIRHS